MINKKFKFGIEIKGEDLPCLFVVMAIGDYLHINTAIKSFFRIIASMMF